MSSPYAGGTPSNGNYSLYYNNGMNSAKFNPTMAVIIIVLIGGCFVLGFVSIFVRKCLTGNRTTGTPTSGNGGWNPKSRGLDKEAVDALPIVHITDLDEKVDRECPVCLTEFEPEDNLRLLLVCKHIFHQECIDAWFDAHSTCPLCRASLTNVASIKTSGEQCGAREPAVPATATEVSESNDIDIDLQPTAPEQDASETAATTALVGGTISREDSLTSARGTLSRNSQSFKRAARGTTALEKAESLGAANRKPPTAPQTSNRKPPLAPASATTGICRSSSLGTDLMALRSLLTGGDQAASTRLASGPAAAAAQPNSWFARPRSMDSSRPLPRTHSSENWSSIDLESAKPSSGEGETSTAGQERTWSDRWSLASLRGAMFPLSRTTSDITTRMTSSRLPV